MILTQISKGSSQSELIKPTESLNGFGSCPPKRFHGHQMVAFKYFCQSFFINLIHISADIHRSTKTEISLTSTVEYFTHLTLYKMVAINLAYDALIYKT